VKVIVSLVSGELGETVKEAFGLVGSSGSAAARCTTIPVDPTSATNRAIPRRGVISMRVVRAKEER
jgi:hypothetical protein